MQNKQIATDLIEMLGGKDNIERVECCMTRVRVAIKDATKSDEKKIRSLEGVFGILGKANDLQIVFGPGDAQEIVQFMENILSN
ncbi:MAG: PTS transporter subunit EIIB [Chloroflexi bacterium]|jgi:PTS system sucrose-specific IIC component|nr:PTS transporter subunit EIIB [Chloroflexota bacterium]